MSYKKRVEKLEERLNLNEKEKRILVMHLISANPVDLPGFPYEDSKDCKNYQRQIKELKEKDPHRQVWIVKLDCKDCKENCKFTGMAIGIGKGKNES